MTSKSALVLGFFKSWNRKNNLWDNASTVIGGVAVYMLYNGLSVFDVLDWFTQLDRSEWSDLILCAVLMIISLLTGKKPASGDEPILLTERVGGEQ